MGALNTIPPNPFPPSMDKQGDSGEPYVLPTASADTLGGVKVGNGLAINDGVLSASGGGSIVYNSTTPYSGTVSGFNSVVGTLVIPANKGGTYTLIEHNRPSVSYNGTKIGTDAFGNTELVSSGLQIKLTGNTTYYIFHGENTTDVTYSDYYVEALSVQ